MFMQTDCLMKTCASSSRHRYAISSRACQLFHNNKMKPPRTCRHLSGEWQVQSVVKMFSLGNSGAVFCQLSRCPRAQCRKETP